MNGTSRSRKALQRRINRGLVMHDGVEGFGDLGGAGMLPDVTSHGDAGGPPGDGLFHHLEQGAIIAHGGSAQHDHGHEAGFDDGTELLRARAGGEGGLDDVRSQLGGGTHGVADVFQGVIVRTSDPEGQRLEDHWHVRVETLGDELGCFTENPRLVRVMGVKHVHHRVGPAGEGLVGSVEAVAALVEIVAVAGLVAVGAQADALALEDLGGGKGETEIHDVAIHDRVQLLDQPYRVFETGHGDGGAVVNGEDDGASVGLEKAGEVLITIHVP